MTKDEFINFLQDKFPRFSSVSNTDLKTIFLELLDYINTNLTFDDIIDIPLLQLLKAPVGTMVELKDKYPVGQKGWFTFVAQEKTFAFWDINLKKWDLIKTNVSGESNDFSILTLVINSINELDRTNLEDGIYNVQGAETGLLFVANKLNGNTLTSVLQVFISSNGTKIRTIQLGQAYPAWKVLTDSNNQKAFGADLFIIDLNGFNNTSWWIGTNAVYPFLLIPGSYGVYFSNPPVANFQSTQQKFTLKVEYASASDTNSNGNKENDYTHTLTNPITGASYIRKISHDSNGALMFTNFIEVKGSTTVINPPSDSVSSGIEFIFKVSSVANENIKPTSIQSDNYIPSGWSATLGNLGPNVRYGYMCKRHKSGTVWGEFSNPALIAYFAKDGEPGTPGNPGQPGAPGLPGSIGLNGKDGKDFELVFKRTQAWVTPVLTIPYNHLANEEYQRDDYLPNYNTVDAWTDNPTGVEPTFGYEYVSKRIKKEGVWQAFSTPALWARFAEAGTIVGPSGPEGKSYEYVYKTTGNIPTSWGTLASINVDKSVPDNTWSTVPLLMNSTDKKYQWIIQREKIAGIWGDWSTPVLFSLYSEGTQGPTGKDGKSYEYVFFLTRNIDDTVPAPVREFPNDDTLDDNLIKTNPEGYTVGWTDDPVGVEKIWRYEWVSTRKKVNGVWSPYSPVSLWSVFGQDGRDGSGFEFIFKRTESKFPIPTKPVAPGPGPDSFPPDWSDDMIPPDGILKVSWMSKRTFDGTSWSGYSEPTIWQVYGEDGLPGANATYAMLGKSIINVACLADGTIRTGGAEQIVYVYAYDGLEPAEITSVEIATENITGSVSIVPSKTNEANPKAIWKLTISNINSDLIERNIIVRYKAGGVNIMRILPLTIIKIYNGYAGPALIARGAWSNIITYYGTLTRVDVVSITNQNGDTVWYAARSNAGEIFNVRPETGTDWQLFWVEMDSFEMIATGTLFAENANVAEFIFNGGVLKSQYPTELQQQNPDNRKNLELNGVTGELIANNAIIRGDITATSGLIGGLNIIGDTLSNKAIRIDDKDIPSLATVLIPPTSTNINLSSISGFISKGYDNATSQIFTINEYAVLEFNVRALEMSLSPFISGKWELRKLTTYAGNNTSLYNVIATGVPTRQNITNTINVPLSEGVYYLYAYVDNIDGENTDVLIENVKYVSQGFTGQTIISKDGLYSVASTDKYLYYNRDEFRVGIGINNVLNFTSEGLEIISGGTKFKFGTNGLQIIQLGTTYNFVISNYEEEIDNHSGPIRWIEEGHQDHKPPRNWFGF